MQTTPYVHNRALAEAATDLIADFGATAAKEAKARANTSRNKGNVIKFCHWRQVSQLIETLEATDQVKTIH